MSTAIGLFGGSFNPIHVGHLISARSVAEQAGLDRIVLVPAAVPPHKRGAVLAPAADRLAMAQRAVAGDPLFEVSDIELRRSGPSFTYDTVTEFRARLPANARLCWLIGADSLPELATWSRVQRLVSEVEILTATRPGWDPAGVDLAPLREAVGEAAVAQLLRGCVSTPAIEISASDIRSRVAAGRTIRYLVPSAVEEYIESRQLYRTP